MNRQPVSANIKTRYWVETGGNAVALSEAVQRRLNEGWQLYGHPYYAHTNMSSYHCQALVKEIYPEPIRGFSNESR